MERYTLRRQQIRDRKDEVLKSFPSPYQRMIEAWQRPGSEDQAWLLYSANYLFRTKNVHWAMDPIRLKQRIPDAPDADIVQDLHPLSFVLLTHRHADHLDFELIRALRSLSILWIVPEAILPLVRTKADLPDKWIVVPKMMQTIELEGVQITPFDGLHWEMPLENDVNDVATTLRGVPATGYMVEFSGKRWMFPGDTRTYAASQLPAFGPLDGLFAHLWLGRGCALDDQPPLMDAFCRFCVDLQSRRVVLTHLQEFGRDADDYWDDKQAIEICLKLKKIAREISVSAALLGDSIAL